MTTIEKAKNALNVNQLRKVYDNGFEALKSVDLAVREGDFFALLGPNGAGKSTLLGIVSSLVNKTSGEVEVCGYDIATQASQAKRQLGVVPQEFNFNQFEKVEDVVVTQAGYFGIAKRDAQASAEKWLKKLGLWEKRHDRSRSLSGGMKRRLMIARALVHGPKLLILDEPTAGVDIELRLSMYDFLREINQQGTTIILTTHYLEEAETLCRNIAIIDRGKILRNTSKAELLGQLQRETYVMEFGGMQDIAALAEQLTQTFGDCQFSKNNDGLLEVEVERDKGLNFLFDHFSSIGASVISIRNKSNRLEELFVNLLGDKNLS